MSYAIETLNLTKRYRQPKRYCDLFLHPFRRDEITVLEDINIQVNKGELFGLLGPNGAGKTTLIKIFCTLILPSAGTALVNGHDIKRDGKAIRKSIEELRAKGSALDTGQIEQVIEKNILPAPADNTGTDVFSRNFFTSRKTGRWE